MYFACGIWCLADVSSVSPSSEQSLLIKPIFSVLAHAEKQFFFKINLRDFIGKIGRYCNMTGTILWPLIERHNLDTTVLYSDAKMTHLTPSLSPIVRLSGKNDILVSTLYSLQIGKYPSIFIALSLGTFIIYFWPLC